MFESDLIGEYRSSFKGNGITFSELRHYSPGDDSKHIDWRATARTGAVYTKSFIEERTLQVHIAVDISPSFFALARTGTLPTGIQFAALISLMAENASDLLGISLFSHEIIHSLPTKNTRNHYREVVRSLLSHNAPTEGRTDLSAVLRSLRLSLKRRCLLFIVSDFFSPPFDEELFALTRQHDVVLVLLPPPFTATFPPVGITEFRDSETGELMELDTSSRSVREWIQTQIKNQETKLKKPRSRIAIGAARYF